MLETKIEPYAAAIRKLLSGVVYHDDAVWPQLRDYELSIREYLNKIGLKLVLDEIGNFAYLHDESRDDDGKDTLPALTTRRALNFAQTLLLVLLRERLDEHELRDLDGARLVLNEDEILEMVNMFMVDSPNAQKTERMTLSGINKLRDYGFLTQRRDGRYEVRPLLRTKISADELEDIKQRLTSYIHLNSEADEEEDEESV